MSDLTIVLTWITPSPNQNDLSNSGNGQISPIELDLFVDFSVENKFKCSVSSYLPVCQGVTLNTNPKNEIVKKLGV